MEMFKKDKVRSDYSYKMANLAQKKNRSRQMISSELQLPFVKQQQAQSCHEYSAMTPPKRGFNALLDEAPTIKREDQPVPTRLLFVASNTYKLDYLNSITFDDGKLFNMLALPSQRMRNGRKIKCKCSKSKCQSRYCQCFSHGNICGVDCECTNCHNMVEREAVKQQGEEKGCKCSKSRCLKNYCECYQKGEQCSDKCQCVNCGNFK